MTVKTLYFKNVTVNGALSLQDGGTAPTAATTTTGWLIAKNAAPLYGLMAVGTKSSSLSSTDALTTPALTAASSWRSENPYTGIFAATAWTLAISLRTSIANAIHTGSVKCRIWKSTAVDGSSGNTELTSSIQAGTVSALSNTVSNQSTVTWTPSSPIVFNNEYLFVQCEWSVGATANNLNADALFRIEPAAIITTSDFGITAVGALSAGSSAIAGTASGSTWSATDAAATGMTLSNGGLTVTSPVASWNSIRSTISHKSEKFYVEFLINTAPSNTQWCLFGFASSGFTISSYLGTSNYSCGIQPHYSNACSTGFTNQNITTVPDAAINDVWALAIDFAGNIWIAQNNVWLFGGNPGSGTVPNITFVPATVGALFPAMSLNNGSPSGTFTIQATAASQTYAPPSGFKVWDLGETSAEVISSGTLVAQSSRISGTTQLQTNVVGTLAAQRSTISGIAHSQTFAVGALLARASKIVSVARSQTNAVCALSAQRATISGTATAGAIATGVGALVAQRSTISGTASQLATVGILVSGKSAISGTATTANSTHFVTYAPDVVLSNHNLTATRISV